ncbi:hypothetical protein LSTR_LSTR014895 [Laodelphax striatellus]|uniref:PHD-type domain-containing protein n=1 Tax=Laodelphax striatellus TaxID=195883 RepID=A0A482XVT8_LAOST|nr:hypothetical protein LSTR_LSTR014895 [Laodelphax striatellus]
MADKQVCTVCKASLTRARSNIACSDCKNRCHPQCVNMTKAEVDSVIAEGEVWRCPPCSKLRRQSMKAVSAAEDGAANMSQVIFMLEEAKLDRDRMEKDFNSSFEFVNSKIDDQTKTIDNQTLKLNECLRQIEALRKENVDLRKKVSELEERLEEAEQYSRSNSLEIHGVPEAVTEDVYETVRRVCTALDVNITREKIDVCHRLGKPKGENRPAGIIVKFVRREDKFTVLAKRKVKRNLSTQDIGFQKTPPAPVYINESLSPGRRRLYAAAKEAKKRSNYMYLWVDKGKIFMRKEQGKPCVRITSTSDLSKL